MIQRESENICRICKYFRLLQSYRISLGSRSKGEKFFRQEEENIVIPLAFLYIPSASRKYRSSKEKNLIKKNYNNHTISYPSHIHSQPRLPFIIIVIEQKLFLFSHFFPVPSSVPCETIDKRCLKML